MEHHRLVDKWNLNNNQHINIHLPTQTHLFIRKTETNSLTHKVVLLYLFEMRKKHIF